MQPRASVAVTGAFSLAQLVSGGAGIWVGRHIDAVGPRKVMTAASLIAVPGVATVALAPNLVVFYLGWVLTGVAMAGTLYPPAFAALTSRHARQHTHRHRGGWSRRCAPAARTTR